MTLREGLLVEPRVGTTLLGAAFLLLRQIDESTWVCLVLQPPTMSSLAAHFPTGAEICLAAPWLHKNTREVA